MNGLSTVNIELTSRCNKNCWMCGRRKVERDYPELALAYGGMDMQMVESIAGQLPDGIVVQFHNNGEPLLYPELGKALGLFPHQVRCLDTNGKLLMKQADDIIGNLDTISVSVFEDDPEADSQYAILKEFMQYKGHDKPLVVARCLGKVDTTPYAYLGCLIATRILHNPMGNFGYTSPPTIPEIGICLDALHHLSIDRNGNVSPCVRLDPKGAGVLGNCQHASLSNIWYGQSRRAFLAQHIDGSRDALPLCSTCHYWGVPTGGAHV